MIIGIITSVILIIYLLYQSISDVKTMEVLVWPNNAVMFLSIGLYLYDCFKLHTSIPTIVILVIICIKLAQVCEMYGSGDMKAMISIFLNLRYANISYPHPDIFTFLVSILVANLAFIIWNHTKNVINKEKVKKAAYFPFLLVGYIFGILIS